MSEITQEKLNELYYSVAEAIPKADCIKVGSYEIFKKAMERMGVEKKEWTPASVYSGIKIIEDSAIAPHEAIMVDKEGNVIGYFTI